MQPHGIAVEEKIARIAGRSHGVVTRSQLTRLGISPEEIKQRVRRGTLLREYRGVYRVGHRAPSVEARYMAAVLACGDGALSGPAAAYLLGLLKGRPPAPEVTAPTLRRVRGLKTRWSAGIGPDDATIWRGIPVTTVPRTLVDLASWLLADDLARACHEAGVKHGTTPAQVEAVLERRPTCTGAAKLRAVLLGDVHVTQSRLERRFLRHLRDINRVFPETNRPAGTRRVDCRWPDLHLTVELDSYRFHRSRHAWEQDRRREREAYARGDDFRRYTYGDVFEQSRQMLAELCVLLPERRARM
jgi:hypothetical protein